MGRRRVLVLARHAKSSWATNDPDIARPLSGRGKRDGVAAGARLAEFDIDVALVSPATRAKQTWERHQLGGARASEVRETDALYYAGTDAVIALLRDLPADVGTVLVVGHEPLISDLALTLAAPNALTDVIWAKFPTAALAVLAHDGEWSDLDDGASELVAFEIPRG